jgi:hypothetical protein
VLHTIKPAGLRPLGGVGPRRTTAMIKTNDTALLARGARHG